MPSPVVVRRWPPFLGGQVTVGISGYGEFESQIKAGALRIIGISSDAKVSGIDAPTFKEGGVDVSIQNLAYGRRSSWYYAGAGSGNRC